MVKIRRWEVKKSLKLREQHVQVPDVKRLSYVHGTERRLGAAET